MVLGSFGVAISERELRTRCDGTPAEKSKNF
jgi:hypothetical protein